MSYGTGLWGEDRIGIGAFYFDTSGAGHIGAFYFGDIDVNLSADIAEITVTGLEPTITAVISTPATITPPPALIIVTGNVPQDIIAISYLVVDFVGVPVRGPSPLVVDFTATTNLDADTASLYDITGYRWYFDFDNYPAVYETSTGNTIQHSYTGVYNQKFTVKCCVELTLK